MLSNAFSPSFHLKRCCQTLFHLHFIWIDVVKRFFTSISFETTLSKAFSPSFRLKRCCQKLFHLHYITICYSFGLNNGRIILYDSFCYLKLSLLIFRERKELYFLTAPSGAKALPISFVYSLDMGRIVYIFVLKLVISFYAEVIFPARIFRYNPLCNAPPESRRDGNTLHLPP